MTNLLYDCGWRGKAAVCNDALDVGGEVQIACHQYGCSTHGNTRQQNFYITAKSVNNIVCPAEYIISFLDSEADYVAVAESVAALVNQQYIAPCHYVQFIGTAEIASSGGTIAVKLNFHRRTVIAMVVSRCQLQAVVRGDIYLLAGKRQKIVNHAMHTLGVNTVLVVSWYVVGIFVVWGRTVEADMEADA